MTIIISTIAIIIFLILAVKRALIYRDNCEFYFDEAMLTLTCEEFTDEVDKQNIHTITEHVIILKPVKSDIYDIEITGLEEASIISHQSKNIAHLTPNNSTDKIVLKFSSDEQKEIKLTYKDSKNNVYTQTLSVEPPYKDTNTFVPSKVYKLSDRKWKGFKNKNIEFDIEN